MTIGTKLFFKGDFSNSPRHGVVIAIKGEMLTVKWVDGGTLLVPEFTITPIRWVVG